MCDIHFRAANVNVIICSLFSQLIKSSFCLWNVRKECKIPRLTFLNRVHCSHIEFTFEKPINHSSEWLPIDFQLIDRSARFSSLHVQNKKTSRRVTWGLSWCWMSTEGANLFHRLTPPPSRSQAAGWVCRLSRLFWALVSPSQTYNVKSKYRQKWLKARQAVEWHVCCWNDNQQVKVGCFLLVDGYEAWCRTGVLLPVCVLLEARLHPCFSLGSNPPQRQTIQASVCEGARGYSRLPSDGEYTVCIHLCPTVDLLLFVFLWNKTNMRCLNTLQ